MNKLLKWGLYIIGGFLVLTFAVAIINNGKLAPARTMTNLAQDSFSGYGENSMVPLSTGMANYDKSDQSGGQTSSPAQRLLIQTGSMSLVVKNVREALEKISNFAKAKQGYVVSINLSDRNNNPYATIAIRLPNNTFDQSIRDLGESGEVKSQNIENQDITEEYVDLESQQRNLIAAEQSLLELMKRTGNIPEVLQVQIELKNVRNEIERISGRMKYLKQSADLSMISINLSTDPESLPTFDQSNKWKPLAVAKNATRNMVDSLKGIADFIIVFAIYLPVWLIIATFIYLAVKLYQWIKRKKQIQ